MIWCLPNLGKEEETSQESHNLIVSKAENAAFESLFEQLCQDGEAAGRDIPKLEEINFGADSEKLRRKRLRNQTIDYHDLSPRAWNGTVAHLVQKDYSGGGGAGANGVCLSTSANHNDSEQQGSGSEGEEGLGQGLGIILDKLKNIETKLDEIKELEEQNICVATIGHAAAAADDVAKVPGTLPEVGVTPTCSESSLHLLTHMTSDQQDRDAGLRHAQPKSDAGFLVDRACNTAADTEPSVASSVDDVTLMADDDTDLEDASNSETLTGKLKPIVDDDGRKGVVISSPTASPAQPPALTSNLEIASVRSMSEEEEEEGSDFCTEEARERRIEQLAQQIIDEKKKLEKLEEIEAKQRTEQIRITGSGDGNMAPANSVAKLFKMTDCFITSQRLWRPCRSVRRTTRRRQRPQRLRSSRAARRAPVPGARAAPAGTAPSPRSTTAGGATRPATRPSTARRGCTRAAGVPDASRSPTGRTTAGSTASRWDG